MSDDENEICPLCCEDLDLSDKSFYPCKCGYQVCMWCWHRIRETESGLCPACRTPYGDDPHEFSAVDMEDVVKANKEKAAAEKRERERLRAVREQKSRERLAGDNASGGKDRDRDRDGGSSGGGGGGGGSGGGHGGGSGGGGSTNFAGALVSGGGLGSASSFGQFDGADLVAALGSAHHASLSAAGGAGHPQGARGPPEPPKDRSTLATMRVIRRNLVYAVGMPPNIAVEDNLRKPEYFGQYGKISKIVINRNHNPGDPRRASASAYVTFAHKEDTLACILALDGFYHDGRNIRASYGTSKYCSAFIKNVRCNNPDCTYLHHMGDAEDTFTKQEIQAGYVTSGRDVLARQQQIMAQQAAAAFGAGGGSNRRKVGGGGPSGTGRPSTIPVFPPPTYDEPLPKVKGRIQSGQRGGIHLPTNGAPSAASIVAGLGNAPTAPPAPHTTLTPLTPLKRAGSMPMSVKVPAAVATTGAGAMAKPQSSQPPLVSSSSDLTPAESLALQEQRRLAQQQQQQREMAIRAQHSRKMSSSGTAPNSPSHSSVGSSRSAGSRGAKGEISAVQNGTSSKPSGFIGGTIGAIGGSNLHSTHNSMGSPLIGSSYSGNLGGGTVSEPPASTAANSSLDQMHTGSGILGGQPLAFSSENGIIGGVSLGPPAGNIFGGLGMLSDSSSGVDKWGAAGGGSNQNKFGGSGALWGGESDASTQRRPSQPAPIGSHRNNVPVGGPGGEVGGMSLFGTTQSSGGGGSSALASMLGIELPTGSGTLRDSSGPYGGSAAPLAPVGAIGAVGSVGPVGSLSVNGPRVGSIGAIGKPNNMLQPIGAPASSQGIAGGGIPIHGYGNNKHDVALLQSLLPGVNITSGNANRPAAPQYHQAQQQGLMHHQLQQPVGVASLNQSSAQWNQGSNSAGLAPIQQQQQQQQDQPRGNIW